MMKNKAITISYWVSTILITLGVGSAVIFNYFLKTDLVGEKFIELGYPAYLVLPLGIAKILALVVILFVKNKCLRHWAYTGLFYNLILASFSHVAVQDNEYMPAIMMLGLLIVSYISQCKKYSQVKSSN